MLRPSETPAPRLADVLHYVIARTEAYAFGQTKLYKVLWFADLEAFRRNGATITGASHYQKQKLGPIPNGALKALKELKESGRIAHHPVSTPFGQKNTYECLTTPSLDGFSPEEIDIIGVTIESLRSLDSDEVSNLTHDALWDEIDMFKQIPISAAAYRPEDVVDEETLAWALEGD
ncbi:MAG: DUF4065 domain-containing protein [Alphaproteobacteria bacterium]|nr:DUF4065 domain-containing protein [Alphaproteobacteria bacterium]